MPGRIGPNSQPRRDDAYAYYVLAILVAVNLMANIDRYAFTVVLESIRIDLKASDTEMGLLAGLVFVVFHTLVSVPMGRAADRSNRRTLLAAALAFWSIMTLAVGLAATTWQLALARAGLGVGEAAGIPTSLSLIGQYFSRERRPSAVGIFLSAGALAALVAGPFVGIVTDAHGWRAAFFALAVPGLFLALVLAVTVREPLRERTTTEPGTSGQIISTRSLVKMLTTPKMAWLLASHLLGGVAAGATTTWMAVIYVREHGLNYGQIGLIVGTTSGAAMLVGSLASGALCSRLIRRAGGRRQIAQWIVAYGLAAAPFLALAAGASSVWVAIAASAAGSLLAFARNVAVTSLVMDTVSEDMRGVATSVTNLVGGVLGAAIGPLLVGLASDALADPQRPGSGLRLALIWVAGVTALLGGVLGVGTVHAYRHDREGPVPRGRLIHRSASFGPMHIAPERVEEVA